MIYAEPKDVVACYRLLLGREPDAAGLKNFTDLVSGGKVSTSELATLFIASPEFVNIQQASIENSNKIERVRMRNFPFEMDTAPSWNAINREIYKNKTYEPHITREILNTSLDGKNFVDCGANIGYFTMLACFLGAKVWSFEPNHRNIWFLLRNLEINNFVAEVYPYAVAHKEEIMIYNPIEGNGQIEPFTGRALGTGQEVIRTVTLDKILEGVHVDVIKLDIEGAEWLALSGATELLKSRPVMFVEFSPGGIEATSKISPLDFLNYLKSLNYRIEVIGMDGSRPYAPNEIIEVALRSRGAFADLKFVPA
jgi:FkbM family methyltransferase